MTFLNQDGPHEKSLSTSENDDFLLNNDLKTIADIFEPLEKKKYVIVATIKGILQNKDWYYPACTNCNTKAFSDTPSNEANVIGSFQYAKYECRNPKCTKTVTSVLPRFMISVRDQDHTGNLIAKTARLGFGTGLYPSEINVLKDMKLAFIVSISKYNVERKNNQYSILRSSDDDKLIQQLEKNFVVSEDAISQTGDNVTPTNVFKSTATSPKNDFDTEKALKCRHHRLQKLKEGKMDRRNF
uniref:Replication factor A C-terminal domain-containing protein n=1 Tax=Lactuca sativa TaxID=4236 RepID=A0A9R1VM16_LACSA|nr:hypothetical protein LSAT_V11C400157650 [Lactuca sativa]